MTGMREDTALKAITGLEGGLVAGGSTCGVVTAGAMGIALMHLPLMDAGGLAARPAVMRLARRYVDWFRHSFQTTLCRERTGVDFNRASGLIRYLLPMDRVCRCIWHTGKAASYLEELSACTPPVPLPRRQENASDDSLHCATEVLRGVREACGIGNDTLERISFVLDGGVALSGGVCGALAGAVMAVNLAFGWDIRHMSYPQTIREFVAGHLNLIRSTTPARAECFAIGKAILGRLDSAAPSRECAQITGKAFADWDHLKSHLRSSDTCRRLIAEAVKTACEAITQNDPRYASVPRDSTDRRA